MKLEFKIHHVALSVANIEKSKEFYGKFGFNEFANWESPDGKIKIKHLKLHDTFLELFAFKDYKPSYTSAHELSTDLPVIGVKHFALVVDSINSAKEFVEKLNIATDIKITKGKTGVVYFFIKDPDGILLEFLEDKRESNNLS